MGTLYINQFILSQNKDKLLQELRGKWYHYTYGSQIDNSGSIKLWKDELIIDSDGKVESIFLDKTILSGVINTTFNPNQVFIYLTALDSKNLSLISFDKQDIYKKIFKVSLLDKQISTFYNMASFGFFSKDKLKESVVLKILGAERNKVLLEENMDSRINHYYNQKSFSNSKIKAKK